MKHVVSRRCLKLHLSWHLLQSGCMCKVLPPIWFMQEASETKTGINADTGNFANSHSCYIHTQEDINHHAAQDDRQA